MRGRVVLVTGANTGIGKAAAHALAAKVRTLWLERGCQLKLETDTLYRLRSTTSYLMNPARLCAST
jgi:NAD(P)-dependent dehydrogenase (short-subunit alcohol dehydrogenase family)